MRPEKLDEYELFFNSINNPFSILVFTETWLTKDKIDMCRLQGFSPIHLLRPQDENIDFKERGGGISIFVHNDIKFKLSIAYFNILFMVSKLWKIFQ